MSFAKTSKVNIWLKFIPIMLIQFGLTGLGNLIVICYIKEKLGLQRIIICILIHGMSIVKEKNK